MTDKPADRWAVPGSTEPEPPAERYGASTSLPPPRTTSDAGRRAGPSGLGGRGRGGGRSLGATGLLVDDPAGGDVPRLALRPMTVADILDGSFGIVKARPARLLGLTAVFVVPIYLLIAYLQRDALGGFGVWELLRTEDPEVIESVEEQSTPLATDLSSTFLGWVGPAVVLVYVAAAIAHLLASWSAGRDVPAGELLSAVGKRSWPLLASFVLVHLAELPGFMACGLGVVFIMPFFLAVAPVIGAEGAGPFDAMGRAARLARARYWPTLGIGLLIGLVASILGVALSAIFEMAAALIGLHVAWPLLALGQILAAVITTPFVGGATVLLYLDLRMRTEGLDLELAIQDVFGEASS